MHTNSYLSFGHYYTKEDYLVLAHVIRCSGSERFVLLHNASLHSMVKIMTENSWTRFPLLVHIQNVDSSELQCRTAGAGASPSSKPVHVTCLEGSNRFTFVGFSNGTIDVYFRTKFHFITTIVISSGEGKVCNILCSEDENYVAVGFVHGKLSVLRCFHERLTTDGNFNTPPTNDDTTLFKPLYSVSHHVGNEITALFWSFNERNLFIGDSCGLVSQLTVELLEQFPRPIPLKPVVEASSRVMQMDYMFPYLAIATVHSVYLCDIEVSEFVRVQLKRHRDIKATGLCFQLTVNTASAQFGTLQLLISEDKFGLIHIANMEGFVINSVKVSAFQCTTMSAARLFDPVSASQDKFLLAQSAPDLDSILLGHLLIYDSSYIISYTHESIYVLEHNQMQIVAWIHFNKIHKIKLVSNYMFIWHGKTLCLISLTPFRHYGEQLLKTQLVDVLERWIDHAVHAIGWRPQDCDCDTQENETDSNSNNAQMKLQINSDIFQQMVGTPVTDQDEFCTFVYIYAPQDLIPQQFRHLKTPPPESDFAKFLKEHLLPELESIDLNCGESETLIQHLDVVLHSVCEFYSQQNVTTLKKSFPSLVDAMESCVLFLESVSKLVDNIRTSVALVQRCKLLMNNFLQQILTFNIPTEFKPIASHFGRLAQLPCTLDWYTAVGTPHSDLIQDAVHADLIVFLSPFIDSNSLLPIFPRNLHLFSWVVVDVLLTPQNRRNCPFVTLIKAIARSPSESRITSTKFCSQLVSMIYRELLSLDLTYISTILHHLAALLYFVAQEHATPSVDQTLRMVLACLPLQHWSKQEIRQKISELCKHNQELCAILVEASFRDGLTQNLCGCGLPILCKGPVKVKPKAQNDLDECLLELLFSRRDPGDPLEKSFAFQFAMKRSLVQHLIGAEQHNLSSEMLARILVRFSSCDLLIKMAFTNKLMHVLVDKFKSTDEYSDLCDGCGCQLSSTCSCPQKHQSNENKEISLSCVGIWILKNNGLNKLVEILKECNMNVAGTFGPNFYRSVAATMKRKVGDTSTRSNTCLH